MPVPILQLINAPIIRAGQSLSSAVDCTGGTIVRINMPLDWLVADLTFQVSADNVAYWDVFERDGTEFKFHQIAAKAAVLVSSIFSQSVGWVKFRSGTRDRPIIQPADRQFQIVLNKA